MDLGRPRDAEITNRIMREARDIVLSEGFSALNYGVLAERAGTSRTAIYRRWSTKTDLALALIQASVQPGSLPTTGSLIEDLVQHAMENVTSQSTVSTGVNPSHLWAVILDPEIVEKYMESIGSQRRGIGRQIISNWIELEALPSDADGDLMLDVLAGTTLFRSAVASRATTEAHMRAVVEALCANPPRVCG